MKMKTLIGSAALAAGLLAANICTAQAPAGAPAGTTALCNDGTYYKGATKSGACSGHKGVKTWYGAPSKTSTTTPASGTPAKPAMSSSAPAPASKPATPAAASAPAPMPSKSTPPASSSKTSTSQMAQAPGGGPGMVWVNTASKVYHCPGTQYYGKTKTGKYMSEADAKAAGNHPVGGKPCGK
jgi:Protein of unknown function (DUF3761)